MQTEAKQDDETEDEAFLRQLVRPEEDRRHYSHAPLLAASVGSDRRMLFRSSDGAPSINVN
jgi:hypothetical protein